MNASLVTPGFRLADVGTDHGYIPIALVQEGVIPQALAMDVNPGPLERAREHVREFGLESQIHTRLSDGVQALRPGEADTVLIAGMGGALTIRILEEGKVPLKTVKELILQPQSEIGQVRRYLEQAGYRIMKEDMVWEDGKYYTVMKAESGAMHYDRAMDYEYGALLLEEKHPVLYRYLEQRKRWCEKIYAQLSAEGRREEKRAARLCQLKEEMQQIEAAQACYDEM